MAAEKLKLVVIEWGVKSFVLWSWFLTGTFIAAGPVGQLVYEWATGWTVRDRIPVWTRFSARPERTWGPPSFLYNEYRVFHGG